MAKVNGKRGRPAMHSSSSPELERLGERLKAVRESEGLGQADFAARFGLRRELYGFFERGVSEPGAELLMKISAECGVSGDFLLSGREPMRQAQKGALPFDQAVMQKCSVLARHVAAGQNPPLAPQAEAQLASELYEFFMGKRQ
ncbi:helix-turn-helix transcriptional regulator [Ferrovibrio sp.]|uniref:helix-turn-helix domain-containing protein n=1 Tax=Ferrovibrio sp. TaxID=1917215 RepID=UPI0025BF1639|nr:helix-turn-helix transcriptional regulator [Ferrovibrio sp.]MBX3455793.1 helix-turn-helix transcriptional regulator [Ferrovibrio sp.]